MTTKAFCVHITKTPWDAGIMPTLGDEKTETEWDQASFWSLQTLLGSSKTGYKSSFSGTHFKFFPTLHCCNICWKTRKYFWIGTISSTSLEFAQTLVESPETLGSFKVEVLYLRQGYLCRHLTKFLDAHIHWNILSAKNSENLLCVQY
jgi:hypothetical protein